MATKKTATTPKNTKTDDAIATFRAARSSSEETFELGTSRVRITWTPAGIVSAIDDFAGGSWLYRKNSAIDCNSRAQAEQVAMSQFASERIKAEKGSK